MDVNSDDFIIIYDPRYYHLLDKNKWRIIQVLNDSEYKIQYLFDQKPDFCSDFCRKYLPKIKIYKICKLEFFILLKRFDKDILEKIITYLPDKYTTTVQKRFCRNSSNKWIISGDRCFYNPEENDNNICWKWYGGDDSVNSISRIGWIESYY